MAFIYPHVTGRAQRSDQRENSRDLRRQDRRFCARTVRGNRSSALALTLRWSWHGSRRCCAPGTIRRVRQTLLATNLADGALVAWKVAPEKIDAAFDWMFQRDPFSGHVVLRSTDTVTAGSEYKLWTTIKVPHGFSLQRHGELLAEQSARIISGSCRRREFSLWASDMFGGRRSNRGAKRTTSEDDPCPRRLSQR